MRACAWVWARVRGVGKDYVAYLLGYRIVLFIIYNINDSIMPMRTNKIITQCCPTRGDVRRCVYRTLLPC